MPETPGTPCLVLVCGLVASGKSSVAAGLAQRLGLEQLCADETRRELFECGAEEAFAPGFSARVYEELLGRAGAALDAGRGVVLDGTFRTRALRARALRLAAERGLPFLCVECRPGLEVCRRRVQARDRAAAGAAGPAPDRGWQALFEHFLPLWEPVDELPAEAHVVVDSGGGRSALDALLVDLERRVLRFCG